MGEPTGQDAGDDTWADADLDGRDGPTGAPGWRRRAVVAMVGGAAIAVVSTIAALLLVGDGDDDRRVEEPCDLLEIQLAYLEGAEVGDSEPAADALTEAQLAAEVARLRQQRDDLGC